MSGKIYTLMDPLKMQPSLKNVQSVENVEFHTIKRKQPGLDEYRFLHGVIVAKYHGILYSCWASNQGEENTDTEVVCGCYSCDGGKVWSDSNVWIKGEINEGVSHGAFLVAEDKLWGFFPHFTGLRQDVKMYLYQMQEDNSWEKIAKITDEPFWPLGEPQKMDNGNYIMPGVYVGGDWGNTNNPAAVAISNGDSLCDWKIIKIPKAVDKVIWGESGVILDHNKITCIFRCWVDDPVALVAVSEDFGVHWSIAQRSNLAMTDSKPCTGTLSTGKKYLIGTTLAENGYLRYPLTIALGSLGTNMFQEIKSIRSYNCKIDRPMNTEEMMLLHYPYATESDGKLYITYSVGFVNKNQSSNYNNYAEIAIVDVNKL